MFLISLLFACDTLETQLKLKPPEEQLIDLRFEYKRSMDDLYQAYGGNELVETINSSDESSSSDDANTNPEPVNQLMATLKNTVTAQDRAKFEKDCLQIGSGQNVMLATTKAINFFNKPDTIESCKNAALAKIKIQQLEKEIRSPTTIE